MFGIGKVFYKSRNDFFRIDIGDECKVFCYGKSGTVDSKIVSNYLYQLLHITFDWNEEYIDFSMIDGDDWELWIEYVDGQVKRYHGHACFPINFEAFLSLNQNILQGVM